jgi:hypothetical protein
MAFVRINRIFAADPSAPLVPKRFFFWVDPFAISMDISCSADLVNLPPAQRSYNIQFQLVNPRNDPKTGNVWFRFFGRSIVLSPTIDFQFANQPFLFTDFVYSITAGRYGELMADVGAAQVPGVFALRGSITAPQFIDLFDMTDAFGFTYELIG